MGRGGHSENDGELLDDGASVPVFTTPGEPSHDYDPVWDYEVVQLPPENLNVLAAQEAANRAFAETEQSFRLYYVKDLNGAMGRYVNGTESFPVIVLDNEIFSQLLDPEQEIYETIRHELRHAEQEREGLDFDEDDAENGWRS